MDEYIEGTSARSLVLAAMTLQKLGNLLEFESREAHMDMMNPWMKKKLVVFKVLTLICPSINELTSPSKKFIQYVSTEANDAPPAPPPEETDFFAHLASVLAIADRYMPEFLSAKGISHLSLRTLTLLFNFSFL